jgi:HK97 family phage prohead protease
MLEIRTATFERSGNKLAGYAAVYDAPSYPLTVRGVNNGKPFVERVARGAFDSSLSGNVSMLVGHDRRELLANTRSGLLKLGSDTKGLAFEVDLPDTQRARDVRALVEAGVLTEMSFGFYVRSDAWKGSERTLSEVDLREISIVENGAYPQTSAEARNYAPALARLRLRLRALT